VGHHNLGGSVTISRADKPAEQGECMLDFFFGSILKVSGIGPLCFLATNYHHLPQKLPHLYKF
jgi:hypothetical protein